MHRSLKLGKFGTDIKYWLREKRGNNASIFWLGINAVGCGSE